MKKVLFITNLANKIGSFSTASMYSARQMGIEFYCAANWNGATKDQIVFNERQYGIHICHVDISRSPFSKVNIKAYKQLLELIKRENIDYIHCNTPVGGLLGRLAGKKCKVKKVIYQVHGFHFYKGAPKKNWFLYYPIEKWLAHYTDALITINQEDYEIAKSKFKLRNGGNVYYVPGVGIDVEPYRLDSPEEARRAKREELGLAMSDFVALSVGRLDKNKNNKTLLEAIHTCENSAIHLVLCGDGEERDMLASYAKELGIEKQIHFLGNRTDMPELYNMADGFVMASFREGLSRSIMEAMASGLPCIVSRIRGNVDLIIEEMGGFLYAPTDADGFAAGLKRLYAEPALRASMKKYNLTHIQKCDILGVERDILKIYSRVFS